MNKIIKRIGWMLALAVIGTIGIPYYFWRQATALPDWYQQDMINPLVIDLHDPDAIAQARRTVADKMAAVQSYADGTQEIYLTEQDVNALAAVEVDRLANYTRLTEAIRSVNTTIRNGQIKSGAVINLANIPTEALDSNEQNLVATLLKTFPVLAQRQVYVGIEGTPAVVDGQLQFDHSLRIQVGNLSLSVADIAQQLGISEATLWQEINRELETLQLREAEISGNQVRLRGVI
ncbi:hypothetical protein ACN4EK_13530 [Pantanalinema rosaneae CENA516]|uniref:hypothetical protein n=1 Tax=Pantanalinema rosaneae TaxID=1620701 RepID=UPI003D6FDE56